MKKATFYTLLYNRKTGAVAVVKQGYSDGTYYYYYNRDCATWHAIHPRTGVSVSDAGTRKKCAEIAHTPRRAAAVDKKLSLFGEELIKRFDAAVNRDMIGEGAKN